MKLIAKSRRERERERTAHCVVRWLLCNHFLTLVITKNCEIHSWPNTTTLLKPIPKPNLNPSTSLTLISQSYPESESTQTPNRLILGHSGQFIFLLGLFYQPSVTDWDITLHYLWQNKYKRECQITLDISMCACLHTRKELTDSWIWP